MENASKALIMAGAILVAILIVSLGVLIFNNFSKYFSNNSGVPPSMTTPFSPLLGVSSKFTTPL